MFESLENIGQISWLQLPLFVAAIVFAVRLVALVMTVLNRLIDRALPPVARPAPAAPGGKG